MKTIIFSLSILLLSFQLFSQEIVERRLRGFNPPEELVSLSPDITFNQAISVLSEVSEKTTGRRIVSNIDSDDPIGILIENMDYKQALIIIVQMAGFLYDEKEDMIIVRRRTETAVDRTKETYASVDAREIKISAVFFELDVNESKQRGIDWQYLLSRRNLRLTGEIGLSAEERSGTGGTGGGGGAGQQQISPEAEFGVTGNFNAGGFFGQATALFRLFESENLGEIIASPNVTVRDRNEARLQVGSDISIKQRDFAGNVIENFFSTGTIINVIPYHYREDGLDYVLLNLNVERSSYQPDPTTTIINKTTANTQVIMLDGEETVIGGLFTNQETKGRSGIPILKDLPWWVFGIRYLAGSEETFISKRELVILIKAELVPTLKERLAAPQPASAIKEEILKQRESLQIHKFNQELK
jgi:general secretion pathway protein D